MRCLFALFALVLAITSTATGYAQAADPPKGLFLMTDYPSQTVRAGEITTIRMKLNNAGLPPEPVALSVSGAPAGWKIDLLGGGQTVASAMPGVNQDVSLQLRVDVPKDAQPGSHKITVSAKGILTQAPDLVMTLTVANEAPAKLSIKSRLPAEGLFDHAWAWTRAPRSGSDGQPDRRSPQDRDFAPGQPAARRRHGRAHRLRHHREPEIGRAHV